MVVCWAIWWGCGVQVWRVGVFVIRVRKNVKKPCKHWFTGLVVVDSHLVSTQIIYSRFVILAEVLGKVVQVGVRSSPK